MAKLVSLCGVVKYRFQLQSQFQRVCIHCTLSSACNSIRKESKCVTVKGTETNMMSDFMP